MKYKIVNYKKIINKITNKDKLFIGDYIIDPYQNCEFGCKYCDSSYEDIVYIKNNFINRVKEEIINLSKGTIIIGSVVDPYQNIEKNYEYTRNLLKIIKENNFNLHILTKSDLILRDIDILSKINDVSVTFSIISLNQKLSDFFETKVPSSLNRLKIVEKLSKKGINSGLAIIPILPYLIEKEIVDIIDSAVKYKSNYLLFKHLELKGYQKEIFYNHLKLFDSNLPNKYMDLFGSNFIPNSEYIDYINDLIIETCGKYNLSNVIK